MWRILGSHRQFHLPPHSSIRCRANVAVAICYVMTSELFFEWWGWWWWWLCWCATCLRGSVNAGVLCRQRCVIVVTNTRFACGAQCIFNSCLLRSAPPPATRSFFIGTTFGCFATEQQIFQDNIWQWGAEVSSADTNTSCCARATTTTKRQLNLHFPVLLSRYSFIIHISLCLLYMCVRSKTESKLTEVSVHRVSVDLLQKQPNLNDSNVCLLMKG